MSRIDSVTRMSRRQRGWCIATLAFAIGAAGGCQTTAAPAKKATNKPPPAAAKAPTKPSRLPSAEAYRAVLESNLLEEMGESVQARERIEEALLSDPQSAFLFTRLGEMRLAGGDIEGAAAAAAKALDEKPKSVPAIRLLATARALQSDVKDAVRLYKRALDIEPGDRGASTSLAEIYLKNDDVRAAEDVIKALMAREPNATDGYVTLAQLFAERGQVDDALRHLDAALERDSRDVEAIDLARMLYEAKGDFKGAVKFAKRIVRERGDSRGARHILLRALLLADENEEAATLVTSWTLNDDSDDMLLLIADAMERSGDPAGASELLRTRRKKSATARVRAERGRLAYSAHAFDVAKRELCDAVDGLEDEWRDFALTLCLRALAFSGDRELAIGRLRGELKKDAPTTRVLTAAAEIASTTDNAAFRRDVLEAFERDFDVESASEDQLAAYVVALEDLVAPTKARRLLDEAIRARPKNNRRKLLLARHLERQGDAIAAVAIVEALFDFTPPTEPQLNFVAFTLADNALRPADAVAYAWRALVRSPTSGYLLDTLGWAEFRAGDLDAALTHLERADRFSANESEILLHLAQVWVAKGDRTKARAVAKRALDSVLPGDKIRERIEALLIALDEDSA